MNQALKRLRIDEMSIDERLDLIGLIWDSISDLESDVPLPDEHSQELERRRKAAEADPHGGIPWEEVKARLRTPG